jgi:hypothetical protein
MKMMHGAAAVVASVLAMLLLAPSDATSAHGIGARGFHFPIHHSLARHLARHRFPLYGSYLTLAPYDPFATYALPQPIGFVREQRSCRYDRQVVTVASEQGGTRQITITRC